RRRGDGSAAVGWPDLIMAAGMAGAQTAALPVRHCVVVYPGQGVILGEKSDPWPVARLARAENRARRPARGLSDFDAMRGQPVTQCRGRPPLHVGQLRLAPQLCEMALDHGPQRRPTLPRDGNDLGIDWFTHERSVAYRTINTTRNPRLSAHSIVDTAWVGPRREDAAPAFGRRQIHHDRDSSGVELEVGPQCYFVTASLQLFVDRQPNARFDAEPALVMDIRVEGVGERQGCDARRFHCLLRKHAKIDDIAESLQHALRYYVAARCAERHHAGLRAPSIERQRGRWSQTRPLPWRQACGMRWIEARLHAARRNDDAEARHDGTAVDRIAGRATEGVAGCVDNAEVCGVVALGPGHPFKCREIG